MNESVLVRQCMRLCRVMILYLFINLDYKLIYNKLFTLIYSQVAESRVVQQRLVKSSWAAGTISTIDMLNERYSVSDSTVAKGAASKISYPLPLTIAFMPKKNVKYISRFRFSCEYGNSFDIVLQGEGTFEEHEHAPLTPVPGQ